MSLDHAKQRREEVARSEVAQVLQSVGATHAPHEVGPLDDERLSGLRGALSTFLGRIDALRMSLHDSVNRGAAAVLLDNIEHELQPIRQAVDQLPVEVAEDARQRCDQYIVVLREEVEKLFTSATPSENASGVVEEQPKPNNLSRRELHDIFKSVLDKSHEALLQGIQTTADLHGHSASLVGDALDAMSQAFGEVERALPTTFSSWEMIGNYRHGALQAIARVGEQLPQHLRYITTQYFKRQTAAFDELEGILARDYALRGTPQQAEASPSKPTRITRKELKEIEEEASREHRVVLDLAEFPQVAGVVQATEKGDVMISVEQLKGVFKVELGGILLALERARNALADTIEDSASVRKYFGQCRFLAGPMGEPIEGMHPASKPKLRQALLAVIDETERLVQERYALRGTPQPTETSSSRQIGVTQAGVGTKDTSVLENEFFSSVTFAEVASPPAPEQPKPTTASAERPKSLSCMELGKMMNEALKSTEATSAAHMRQFAAKQSRQDEITSARAIGLFLHDLQELYEKAPPIDHWIAFEDVRRSVFQLLATLESNFPGSIREATERLSQDYYDAFCVVQQRIAREYTLEGQSFRLSLSEEKRPAPPQGEQPTRVSVEEWGQLGVEAGRNLPVAMYIDARSSSARQFGERYRDAMLAVVEGLGPPPMAFDDYVAIQRRGDEHRALLRKSFAELARIDGALAVDMRCAEFALIAEREQLVRERYALSGTSQPTEAAKEVTIPKETLRHFMEEANAQMQRSKQEMNAWVNDLSQSHGKKGKRFRSGTEKYTEKYEQLSSSLPDQITEKDVRQFFRETDDLNRWYHDKIVVKIDAEMAKKVHTEADQRVAMLKERVKAWFAAERKRQHQVETAIADSREAITQVLPEGSLSMPSTMQQELTAPLTGEELWKVCEPAVEDLKYVMAAHGVTAEVAGEVEREIYTSLTQFLEEFDRIIHSFSDLRTPQDMASLVSGLKMKQEAPVSALNALESKLSGPIHGALFHLMRLVRISLVQHLEQRKGAKARRISNEETRAISCLAANAYATRFSFETDAARALGEACRRFAVAFDERVRELPDSMEREHDLSQLHAINVDDRQRILEPHLREVAPEIASEMNRNFHAQWDAFFSIVHANYELRRESSSISATEQPKRTITREQLWQKFAETLGEVKAVLVRGKEKTSEAQRLANVLEEQKSHHHAIFSKSCPAVISDLSQIAFLRTLQSDALQVEQQHSDPDCAFSGIYQSVLQWAEQQLTAPPAQEVKSGNPTKLSKSALVRIIESVGDQYSLSEQKVPDDALAGPEGRMRLERAKEQFNRECRAAFGDLPDPLTHWSHAQALERMHWNSFSRLASAFFGLIPEPHRQRLKECYRSFIRGVTEYIREHYALEGTPAGGQQAKHVVQTNGVKDGLVLDPLGPVVAALREEELASEGMNVPRGAVRAILLEVQKQFVLSPEDQDAFHPFLVSLKGQPCLSAHREFTERQSDLMRAFPGKATMRICREFVANLREAFQPLSEAIADLPDKELAQRVRATYEGLFSTLERELGSLQQAEITTAEVSPPNA